VLKDEAQLDGLPADYVARHGGGGGWEDRADDRRADYRPVMTYAKSADLRINVPGVQRTRVSGEPGAAGKVLKTRAELARELGFANWESWPRGQV